MNYSELSTAIQDYTENYETTFVTHIPTFVKQAEKRIYNAAQLPVLRKNVSGSLTTSNKYLATPSDFLAPYELLVTSGTSQHPTLFKDVSWIREAFADTSVTGIPKYYALYDNSYFILAPTPDSGYTVELHYYYYPETIVTASTTWLGDNFDIVLLYGALVEAYTFMKGETDLLAFYDTKFKEALAELKQLGEAKSRMDTYRTEQIKAKVI